MGFIKLTRQNGSPVYVNMVHIKVITEYHDVSAIDIDGWDTYLYVKESPESIMNLIQRGTCE